MQNLDPSVPIHLSPESVLQEVVKGTAMATGKEFFAVLVESLAAALSVRNCVVSQRLDSGVLETLGFFRNNQLQSNITYDPVGAPCDTVLKENEYYCQSGIQALFPDHPVLEALEADSYVGVSLENVDGKILGILLVIDSNPIADGELHQSILKIFAGRAAAELERQRLNDELEMRVEQRTVELQTALQELKDTQTKLVQSEKMSSLGQLIAGIAHEINNPNTFILANVSHVASYTEQLLELIRHYQTIVPNPSPEMTRLIANYDLEFVEEDLPRLLGSMQSGSDRIQELVHSFRNFSRLGESDKKIANLHDGINSTLILLSHRLRATVNREQVQIIKRYSILPKVECFPGQLNQVFMNILTNAVDALDQR
ncbi:MAG: GAF domain-containing protein, partial [Cyanobacteria bacterium P01_D01_bin.56]